MSQFLDSWILENGYVGKSDEEIVFWEDQKWEHEKWMEENYNWLSVKRLKCMFGLLIRPPGRKYLTRDELLELIDLHDIVIQYTNPTLIRDGECMARCPFHKDSSASFSYNRKKGVWICFSGCGSGSAIEFVMLAEQLDYKSAFNLLTRTL